MATQTLHGACACGRNRYVVEIPSKEVQHAELRYDNTSASRHHSANPLTLWLRVPLSWYTSATFAQFPDETRLSIQRSFISPFTANHRRVFCGYCGTQLSSWNEQTREEAEHICLTVGSLLDEDQSLLGDLGFLPNSDSSDEDIISSLAGSSRTNPTRVLVRPEPSARGAPWFEEIVQHTRLGRLKQQRGGHSTSRVHVEWEVVEWTEADDADDESHATPIKRKISEVEAAEDSEMRNV
ncbi:hypothetical protein GQ44DRAFT_724316 [Phaeosphaeriaceae sp. PMI808]|nr:hypothetical protein GQ44DRAFT_724316 [Phaeosphaeriaceae sp. PMI808]